MFHPPPLLLAPDSTRKRILICCRSNVRSVLNTAIAPQTGMAVIPHTNANDPKRLPVVLTVYVENNEITQEFTGGNRGWGGGMLRIHADIFGTS